MPKKLDYIDEIMRAGAIVVKPKPPAVTPPPVEEVVAEPTPTELIPPAIEESPGIEVLTSELETEWKHSTTSQPDTYHADELENPPEIDEVIDAVVVFWEPERKFGFARQPNETGNRKNRRDGLYFSAFDTTTTGEETLRPGSMIRGTVTEPRPGHQDRRLTNVEIYQTEEK
jgi:hypothetical protein